MLHCHAAHPCQSEHRTGLQASVRTCTQCQCTVCMQVAEDKRTCWIRQLAKQRSMTQQAEEHLADFQKQFAKTAKKVIDANKQRKQSDQVKALPDLSLTGSQLCKCAMQAVRVHPSSCKHLFLAATRRQRISHHAKQCFSMHAHPIKAYHAMLVCFTSHDLDYVS